MYLFENAALQIYPFVNNILLAKLKFETLTTSINEILKHIVQPWGNTYKKFNLNMYNMYDHN